MVCCALGAVFLGSLFLIGARARALLAPVLGRGRPAASAGWHRPRRVVARPA